MTARLRRIPWLALLPALVASACSGIAPGSALTGDGCGGNEDCASSFCLPFAGGYCSALCGQGACPDGAPCRNVSGLSVCLKPCQSAGDCRDGYMCFRGGCRPACQSDGECARGYYCQAGSCAPLSGKSVGSRCSVDGECSSRDCEPQSRTCQIACAGEVDCPSGQTCFVNPVDPLNVGATTGVRPICIARRSGVAVGEACRADADCAQGQCEIGLCTILCAGGADCPAGLACVQAVAQVDDGAPKIKACLPARGTVDFNLGKNYSGGIGLPAHAVSLALFLEAKLENPAYYLGYDTIVDPNGDTIYSARTGFYDNPLRWQPGEGAAMMLISNSPMVKFAPLGLYTVIPFAQNPKTAQGTDYTLRARVKLFDGGAFTAGTTSLHVFITDLAGGCVRNPIKAADAPTRLAPFEAKLKTIFAQAGVTLDAITYKDTTANSLIDVSSDGTPSPQLDNLLKDATTGDTPGALELVIIRDISSGGTQGQILGISGGIPAATGIPGTLHSGATAALTALCADASQATFALTAAHELGHSLGLFHSVEQDGHTDQCADNDRDGVTNLMHWEEGSVKGRISPCQGDAMRMNPVVRP